MDEAGNTGAALLDPDQTVFTLASTDFTKTEAASILAQVAGAAPEPKFSTLRKSGSGRHRLIQFLRDEALTPDRVKVNVFHKEYMVVCKMVDLLTEAKARRAGLDLYNQGQNIALANLIYFVGPHACGKSGLRSILDAFVGMIRNPEESTILRFQKVLRDQIGLSRHQGFEPLLGLLELDDTALRFELSDVNYLELDPAIPAFVEHCYAWGRSHGCEFDIIHDQSKPIASERSKFEALMDKTIPQMTVGYDRRTIEFPLRASSLSFGDSKQLPQLQVADLIAGGMMAFAMAMATGKKDPFSVELEEAGIERFQIGCVWPFEAFTPAALKTDGPNSVSHIDLGLPVFGEVVG
jgi:hypothetical protein